MASPLPYTPTYTPHRAAPALTAPAGARFGVIPGSAPNAMPDGAPNAAPNAVPSASPVFSPAVLDTLLDALRSERRLVDDLAATMRRQRTAVGSDDLETVDDTVFATHRLLATLGQARLRRRQLNRLIAGADDVPVRTLTAALGSQMTESLRDAAAALLDGAAALAREVEVNRRVLRDALAAGDDHARALRGLPSLATAAAAPNGVPNAMSNGAPAVARLVDRTA